jgi:hypothetical protein
MHGVYWAACMHGVANEAPLIARIATGDTANWGQELALSKNRKYHGKLGLPATSRALSRRVAVE